MKNYLLAENDRNHRNHRLYERLMRMAVGDPNAKVLVAHHLCFEMDGEEETIEVPSADTLMFDHDLMKKVFGDNFFYYMAQLAVRPAEQRDLHLAYLLDKVEAGDSAGLESTGVRPCLLAQ